VQRRLKKVSVRLNQGLASRPFTWGIPSRSSTGSWLATPTRGLCREIKDAVRSVENIQVRDLMKLLGRVKAG